MVAFSVEQHEVHLGYQKKALKDKQQQLRELQAEVYAIEVELAFFEHQIEQAKKKRKRSFDSEKFLNIEKPDRRQIVREFMKGT